MKEMINEFTNETITIISEVDYSFTYKTENSTRVLVKTKAESYEYLEMLGYKMKA